MLLVHGDVQFAAAGWYQVHDGDERDCTQCFMCGKSLSGWEKDEDPLYVPWARTWLKLGKRSGEDL